MVTQLVKKNRNYKQKNVHFVSSLSPDQLSYYFGSYYVEERGTRARFKNILLGDHIEYQTPPKCARRHLTSCHSSIRDEVTLPPLTTHIHINTTYSALLLAKSTDKVLYNQCAPGVLVSTRVDRKVIAI